jgi:hypothetical protein
MTWTFVATGVHIQIPAEVSRYSQLFQEGLENLLLVIILRIPPLPCGQNLRNHLPLPPLLINFLRNLPRYPLLLIIMVENPASILSPRIRALAIRRCRVMHLVEELEELCICNL